MSLLSITLVLFLIMDPIGNVAPYLKMKKGVAPERQTRVLIREMLIALLVMLFFNYLGEHIFSLLELSEIAVQISSGVVLSLFAIQVLFSKIPSIRDTVTEEEPFIIPLAIPLIAGPSLLATIMLYARLEESLNVMLAAIVIAWFCALIVLLCSSYLYKILGDNGLIACEKLMGMVLILLAIQRFLDGVAQFAHSLHIPN